MSSPETLMSEIRQLEQQIRQLKAAERVPAYLKSYYLTFAPEPFSATPENNTILAWEITYGEGTQPILTEVIGGTAGVMLGAINGNRQRLYFYAGASYDHTIISTRPIITVVPI